jgi:glycogen operon protein
LVRILPGTPEPQGATWDGEAVNFALFSAHATRVELCLFDAPDAPHESARVELSERSGDVWHARLPGVRAGQLYGYRVHGPWAPDAGHRFNPSKLLVDPYARALCGELRWSPALYGHAPDDPARANGTDSAPWMPRSVVVGSPLRSNAPPRPAHPWSRSLIYECHVRGATRLHPALPPGSRGRFLGLADPAVIAHLHSLGVTAVELLPVAHSAQDDHLARLSLPNYWGYATLGFFAPDARFASGDRGEQVAEFRRMVDAFHEAGIEVILDVVFNHTPEGGAEGPTLSLRGVDNASYYRLHAGERSRYTDYTGCGNTLDSAQPQVRRLVLDCLRHWAGEMGVDGFRFDLATVLGRDPTDFDAGARFFELLRQDPTLARCKLVAEPWDLGPEGYRLGAFPPGWAEWNDRFRDAARRFWRGDAAQLGELARRLSGSSDLFAWRRRECTASVNFVCAHDGFTLHDLVSYAHRHNEANREGGRDGHHDESHNWGVEGPSQDQRVVRRRERVKRSLVATLAFSQGVPMWLGGDELGRTQGGNNNAYCHDDETSWFDWDLDEGRRELLGWVRRAFALRAGNAVFRRRRHFDGDAADRVAWLRADGAPMQPADWNDPERRSLALLLDASVAPVADEAGHPQAARSALLLLNADVHSHRFALPDPGPKASWRDVLNSADASAVPTVRADHVTVAPHALVLLEREAAG